MTTSLTRMSPIAGPIFLLAIHEIIPRYLYSIVLRKPAYLLIVVIDTVKDHTKFVTLQG